MPMEWDQKEVKAFVVTIKNLNVSVNLPQYTILVMCEMHEISMVKETLKAAGYCKVDLGFYHIEDAVPDSVTLTNAVHPIVIGYWNQDRQLRRQHINTEGINQGKDATYGNASPPHCTRMKKEES
ncbi:uncharacterized protein [Ptychodera flava]|uniref:uncharacterized protein n=1 Tax=Ptychodera flava TaxID=63121 RepID=UPI00396A5068